MYSKRKPMSSRSERARENMDQYEKRTREEKDPVSGTAYPVTRFADGSAIHHFGGMAGDVRTDQFGNEC